MFLCSSTFFFTESKAYFPSYTQSTILSESLTLIENFNMILSASMLNPWSSTIRILLDYFWSTFLVPKINPKFLELIFDMADSCTSSKKCEEELFLCSFEILAGMSLRSPIFAKTSLLNLTLLDLLRWFSETSDNLMICYELFLRSLSLNVNLKHDPLPSSDSNEISPSNFSTICLAIIKPRPMPLVFSCLLS